jgi:hypothetical protein
MGKKKEIACCISLGKPERDHWEDIGKSGRIMLKCIYRNNVGCY